MAPPLFSRPAALERGQFYHVAVFGNYHGCGGCGGRKPDEQRPPPTSHRVDHCANKVAGHQPEHERAAEFACGQLGLGRRHGGEAGDSRHVEHNKGYERGGGDARVGYHYYGLLNALLGALEAAYEHCRQHREGGYNVLLGDQPRNGRNGEYPAVLVELRAEAEGSEEGLDEAADVGEDRFADLVVLKVGVIPAEFSTNNV